MACVWTVEVEAVEVYVKYFDISLIPATVFFWNTQHIKVDYGWWVGDKLCVSDGGVRCGFGVGGGVVGKGCVWALGCPKCC